MPKCYLKSEKMYCMPVVNFRSDRISLHCLLNQLVAQCFSFLFQFPPSAAKLLPKSRRITCTPLVSIFLNSKNGNLFRDIWLQVSLILQFHLHVWQKLQNHKQGSLEQCVEFLLWISTPILCLHITKAIVYPNRLATVDGGGVFMFFH